MTIHPHPGGVPSSTAGFSVGGVVQLVIFLIVVGAILLIINKVPIAEPIKSTINIIVLVLTLIAAIVWLARAAGFM